ncbi:permease-like cell division protein FtsX [Planotetraspora sp. GP83]|uniref:permease-like cell division protein FtsX n=1 Tax=Planotetraspora sp. GP83 TaxID=3156264 RepID=UPI0035195481
MYLSPEPHDSPDAPEGEELSFGDDREPRLGGWLRAHRRLVGVVALSALLLAGASVGGWVLYQRSRQPLPPPDGPWPQTGTFSAFLCQGGDAASEACSDRGAVTGEEKQAVAAVLNTSPVVKDFHFETQEEALANFRALPGAEEDPTHEALLDTIEAADLPESYRGAIGPGDWRALKRRLEALPDVSRVYVFRDHFWWGKANLSIALCPQAAGIYERCEGRGAASQAEKDDVLGRIHALPGVEAVYFEDRAHALKVWRHVWWQGAVTNRDLPNLPEAYYVKLTAPPVIRDIRKSFAGVAGVAQVSDVSGP